MKIPYSNWLKRLVLPFEDPDHHLYADPAKMQELERWQNLSDEGSNAELEAELEEEFEQSEETLRKIFGEGFVQQWRRVTGRE